MQRSVALLFLLCAACGMPGPTPNGYLQGEWTAPYGNLTDWHIKMVLLPGPEGLRGSGWGEIDSSVPPFTIAALDWGHMTWTFADGQTIEYQIGPNLNTATTCPGDPNDPLTPFTIWLMTLHRVGGTSSAWYGDTVYSRTPPIVIQCTGSTGGH